MFRTRRRPYSKPYRATISTTPFANSSHSLKDLSMSTTTEYVSVTLSRNLLIAGLVNEHNEFLQPKHSQVPLEIPHLGKSAMVASFDMSTIHRIPVPSLTPRMPARASGMSDAWYQRLIDASYERTLVARADAEALRRLIKHHVARGNLTVVAPGGDPSNFLTADDTLDDAELELVNDHREAAEAKTVAKSRAK